MSDNKCSFCGKWFSKDYILLDSNNKTFCKDCLAEILAIKNKKWQSVRIAKKMKALKR